MKKSTALKTLGLSEGATEEEIKKAQEAGLEYFTRCYDSRVVTTQSILNTFKSIKTF